MGDGKKSAAKPPSLPAGDSTHYPLPITHYLILATLLAAMMSGCGTTPKREPSVSKAPPTPRGGYYLDDGPGEYPPVDLDSIPDAVPKLEPLHRGASRPYVVMGRDYAPMTSLQPYKARGFATWYGRRYHGKQTSSGETYDMYAMTAAHATLPIPSYARVTNLANGKSVVVRINDRGPFIGDRLIDLSYTAAYKVGVLGGGSAVVEVESIIPGDPMPMAVASGAGQPAAISAAPEIPLTNAASGVYLQLGAFGSKENAETYLMRLKLQLAWLAERLHVFPGEGLYRVHAGPYANRAEARQIADRIGQALSIRPMVLVR